MRNGLRHLAIRFAAAWRSPLSILGGLIAAVLSAAAVAAVAATADADSGLGQLESVLFVALVLGQIGIAAAAIGAGDGGDGRGQSSLSARLFGATPRDWTNPGLPIGRTTRVLAEALAGVLVVMTCQGVLLLVGAVAYGPAASALPGLAAVLDATVLPVAVAWLLPGRAQGFHVLRGVLAAMAGAVAALTGGPLVALLGSSVLTVVLFATADAFSWIERGRPRKGERSARSSLVRRGRPPRQALCRDAWLGPIEVGRRGIWVSGALILAAVALGLVKGVPHRAVQLLTTWAPPMAGFPLVMNPLGLINLSVPSRLGGQGLFRVDAWARRSVLPLRPEWVTRALYCHGLAAGGAFVGLCLAGAWLSGMPNFMGAGMGSGRPVLWAPYLLMVPSFAGFLASRAAGDNRMRTLSLTALVLTVPGYVVGVIVHLADVGGGSGMWLANAIALALAMVGGLPPLVYLFPKRTRARFGNS
jgi:hypothetical protein